MKLRTLAAIVLAATPWLARAQTILVYVQDDSEGMKARGGIYAALFEGGYVFFDPGELAVTDVDWSTGRSPMLLQTAADGGADYVLLASSRSTVTRSAQTRAHVDMALRLYLLAVGLAEPRTLVDTLVEVTNQGREAAVDTTALGLEAGTAVVAAIQPGLASDRRGAR